MDTKSYIIHPSIQANTLEARIYQQTILASSVKENSLVVLPTGLGKTTIMLLISLFRLEKYPKGFILILAPSKPLVEQHRETFQRIMKEPDLVQSMTGAIPPNKREKLWNEAKIAIATPQIVQNDLMSGIFQFEKCVALVIDEAHRTRGNYAYVFVAKAYLKNAKNQLISAFTASPGTSIEEIKDICDALEITNIESRTEKDPDVLPYVQPVEMELIRVKLSKEFQILKNLLKECLTAQLKILEGGGYKLSINNLKRKEMLEIQRKIQEEIRNSTHPTSLLFELIGAASNSIRLLHGNELLETQGIRALFNYLNNIKQKKQTQALLSLTNNVSFQMMLQTAEKLAAENQLHPKIAEVKKIIDQQFKNVPDSRILLFSRFRVTLKLLDQELKRNSKVKSHVFIGQQSKFKDRGMTQKEQYSTLKAFRSGEFNVLLATNIGEEGIDITNCDLVIFYDTVSTIRTIQRRGRTGRIAPGRVIVLVTSGTPEEGRYWISQRKEKEMHKTMKLLSNYSKKLKDTRSHRTLDKFVKKESLVEEREEKGVIAVDQRETKSEVAKNLYEQGFRIELQQLHIADYVVGDVAIERKTSDDFVQSLFDGRLFREIKNMVAEYTRAVLILEGDNPFVSSRAIDPNAIKGALASLFVDFKLPVLQTRNARETADLIAAIARRVYIDKRRRPRIATGTSPSTTSERQKRIIANLPNVDAVLATRLLREFKTPKNIVLAPIEELQKVKGLGSIIASQIREILDSEFDE